MAFVSGHDVLITSRDVGMPMPPLALVPAAWYLGVHMLKCLQEAHGNVKIGNGLKTRLKPRLTVNKGTQTIVSYTQRKIVGRKTPTRTGRRIVDSKTPNEDIKKSPNGGRRSAVEMKPSVRATRAVTAMRSNKADSTVRSSKAESAVKNAKAESAVRTTKRESAAKSNKVESTARCGKVESTAKGNKAEPSVKGSKVESSVKGSKPESTVKGGKAESTVKGSKAESTVKGSQAESTGRRIVGEVKSAKSEVVDQNRSGMPSLVQKSRPMKGGMTQSRRLSTGDCPKRASESCADLDRAKWLKNPVYASDGESDGRRTDRSDMSPPWLDISVAERDTKEQLQEATTMPTPTVLQMAQSAQRQVPVRIPTTQPRMEAVPEMTRSVNLRRTPSVTLNSATRVLSATERSIRETIEKKLGKPLAEVDTASLKAISEKRMKELAEKYARNRPKNSSADQSIPSPYAAQNHLRTRDSADSIYHRVDPQRGGVVV